MTLRHFGWMFVVIAMSTVAAAQQRSLQPDSTAQLADAANTEFIEATFIAETPTSLDAFHDYAQQFKFPLAKVYIKSPSGPASRPPLAGELTGELVGQDGERWLRTTCKLRIAAQLYWHVDIPAADIVVQSWSVIGPAPTIKKLITTGNVGKLQTIKDLPRQRYEYEMEEAKMHAWRDVRFVAENFQIPIGCAAYARNVKGLRAGVPGDQGEVRGQSETKEVLRHMAKEMPERGIVLSLRMKSAASVRDIARLTSNFQIALLRITGPELDTLEFGSEGPSKEEQFGRAACIMKSILDSTNSEARVPKEYLSLKRDWRFFISVATSASEGHRLVEQLPDPFSVALLSDILPDGGLELESKKFDTRFTQAWTTSKSGAIPSGCERHIRHPE